LSPTSFNTICWSGFSVAKKPFSDWESAALPSVQAATIANSVMANKIILIIEIL
jgi:hypothetical protein